VIAAHQCGAAPRHAIAAPICARTPLNCAGFHENHAITEQYRFDDTLTRTNPATRRRNLILVNLTP